MPKVLDYGGYGTVTFGDDVQKPLSFPSSNKIIVYSNSTDVTISLPSNNDSNNSLNLDNEDETTITVLLRNIDDKIISSQTRVYHYYLGGECVYYGEDGFINREPLLEPPALILKPPGSTVAPPGLLPSFG